MVPQQRIPTGVTGSEAVPELDFRSVLESAPDAMVIVDSSGLMVLVNQQTEVLFGYDRHELIGQPVELLVPVRFRADHSNHRAGFAAEPRKRPMGANLDLWGARRDGSEFPVEISLAPMPTKDAVLVSATVRDVTRQRAAQQALRESEERFRLTVDASPIGIALISAHGRWLRVNSALCELLCYSEDELLAMTFNDLLDPSEPRADIALDDALGAPAQHLERKYRCADGRAVWVDLTVSLVRSEQGVPLHFVAQFHDITERRRSQEQLEQMALSDPLTGLPNRVLLLDRVAQAVTNLARNPGQVAMLLLDLDRFKHVNDTLGHQAGDELLREVARRLRAVARASDTVARLGGDEFAILSTDRPSADQHSQLAQRMLDCLSLPVAVQTPQGDTEDITISASIGIATTSLPDTTPNELYRDADLALYRAKGEGRARAAVYDVSLGRALERRIAQESRLRAALRDHRITIVQQPIITLATGKLLAHEVLARLVDEGTGALRAPDDFLPVAEETGLVAGIDLQVLQASLDWLAEHAGRLHLNVSAATLRDPRWLAELLAALEREPSLAGRLGVELTERVLMSATGPASAALTRLRQNGVTVGLDDFGTGYSSLSYLQRLDVDFLKLDVSLVAGIGTNPRSETLSEGLIALAHALGLSVIAEGVTRAVQQERLQEWGCDAAQGFLFGRPMTP